MSGAPLNDSGSGLAPAGDGWFVVNVRDTQWLTSENGEKKPSGSECSFESQEFEFPQLGIRLHVLEPGEPNGLYHSESEQEDFLVLSGECTLLVEGEERVLRPWDFFHSPAGTEHIFLGAGDGPCVILMAGARSEPWQVTTRCRSSRRATAQAWTRRRPIRGRRTHSSSRHGGSGRRTGIASHGPSPEHLCMANLDQYLHSVRRR